MSSSSEQRLLVPDTLKGLAVILMIQVHLMELFARPDLFQSTIGNISLFLGGPFAAPLFMAVMGYFSARSSRTAKQQSLRGIKLILLGFALNVGLNLHLLIKIWNGTFDLDPWRYILGADILILAGLSILFLALVRQVFKNVFWAYYLLAGCIALASDLLVQKAWEAPLSYLQSFIWGGTEWSYFPLIPWLAYPIAGCSFYYFERMARSKGWLSQRNMIILLAILLIVILLYFDKAFSVTVDLPNYYHHGLPYFLWASAFLVSLAITAVLGINLIGRPRPVRYLQWAGKNVTAMYVIQWLMIGNLATALYKTQGFVEIILWFIGITALTSLVTFARNRLSNSL